MSLIDNIILLAEAVGSDIKELTDTLKDISIGPPLSIYRENEDSEGIFTTITYKRNDSTIYKTSVLSNGTSPEYTTRTITYYEDDGVTVRSTQVYTLSYNLDGDLISEVLV